MLQNPKLLRVKEVQIRKNREHDKTKTELKRVTESHAEKCKELEACKEQKADVEENLSKAESESQTGVHSTAPPSTPCWHRIHFGLY